MDIQILVALLLVSPIIILPVLFAWYMNVGGAYSAFRKAWRRRANPVSADRNIEAEHEGFLLNNLQMREE